MKKKTIVFRGLAAVMAFVLMASASAITLTFQYAALINRALGVTTTKTLNPDGTEAENTIYWPNDYGYDADALVNVYRDAAAKNVEIGQEGAVLLKNENSALPIAEGSGITLFGYAAYSSKIQDSSTASYMSTKTFDQAMQDEFGAENVNDVLLTDYYPNMNGGSGGAGGPGGFMMMSGGGVKSITEGEISEVKQYADTWSSEGNDVAVVVFGRTGSEGNDVWQYAETDTYEDGSPRRMLDLSTQEEELISYVSEQKAAGVFKSIVAIIAGDYDVEMGFLEEYDVDACVYAGNLGAYGVEGLVKVLSGKVSPSGRLVDTLAANSVSAPATLYAGHEGTQRWTNYEEVDVANPLVNDSNGDTINWYNIYAEGIYVGYKYYETRYEDTVMGNYGADSTVGSSTGSAWNYADETCYPFGYGLSYTTFQQKLNSVEYSAADDSYTVSVTVTNTGSVAGKEVVQVYAQTPYGDYEKENLVEKASVNLMGFAKTGTLEPGASETVTVSVPRYFLASYDTYGAAGYILSAGDYYLAIGSDCHDALNNILAAKGYTTADGMTAEGDSSKIYTWAQDALDTESYRLSPYTGYEVTNQFEDGDLNYYGVEFTYLTRQDWEGTYPTERLAITATDAIIDTLSNYYYETPEDAPAYDSFTQGADNGMVLTDLVGVDFDDDETWNKFLDQFTVEELCNLMSDNIAQQVVTRLGVVGGERCDDDNKAGGAIQWNSHPTTSRTWNIDLVADRGTLEGITAQLNGEDEIWWGAGNMHRTPFGGRHNQYYSEDANFDYVVGYAEAAAMQATGANICVKHFCTNDQETERQGLTTFVTEQPLREIYARAFEGSFAGGAMGTMTALNRIGTKLAKNHYELITTVLRDEWGFEGHVTSDGYVTTNYFQNACEELTAGMDYSCIDSNGVTGSLVYKAIETNKDGYLLQCIRLAAKRNLNAMLSTARINGQSGDTIIKTIVPGWQLALMATTAVSGVLFVTFTALSVVSRRRQKTTVSVEEVKSDEK